MFKDQASKGLWPLVFSDKYFKANYKCVYSLKDFEQGKYLTFGQDNKILRLCLVRCHFVCVISSWHWTNNKGMKQGAQNKLRGKLELIAAVSPI